MKGLACFCACTTREKGPKKRKEGQGHKKEYPPHLCVRARTVMEEEKDEDLQGVPKETVLRFQRTLLSTCIALQAQLVSLQRSVQAPGQDKLYLLHKHTLLCVAAALKSLSAVPFPTPLPDPTSPQMLYNYFSAVIAQMGALKQYIGSTTAVAAVMEIGKVLKVIKDRLSAAEPDQIDSEGSDNSENSENSENSDTERSESDSLNSIIDLPSRYSRPSTSSPRGRTSPSGSSEFTAPDLVIPESNAEDPLLVSSRSESKLAGKPQLQKYLTSPDLLHRRELGMKKSFSLFNMNHLKKAKPDQEIQVFNPLYGKKIDPAVISRNLKEGKLNRAGKITSKLFRTTNRLSLSTPIDWLSPSKTEQVIPIFGTPLNLIPFSQNRVPKFLENAIDFLQNSPNIDYREMVQTQMPELELLQFQKAIERGHTLDLLPVDEVVVFALLKSFLAQLPDPLICVSSYEDLIQVEAVTPQKHKLNVLKDIILSLPLNHMFSLRLVIRFLHELSPYLPTTTPSTTPATTPRKPSPAPSPLTSPISSPISPTRANHPSPLSLSQNTEKSPRKNKEIPAHKKPDNIPVVNLAPVVNPPLSPLFVNTSLQSVNSFGRSSKSLSSIFASLLLRKDNTAQDNAAKVDITATMINNYSYLFETHTEELTYEMNATASAYIVTAASPRMAAQKLVDPFYTEHDFVDTILLTYSYFSTATELLNSIISLYNTEFSRGAEQLQFKYRLRILYVINLWLQRNLLRLRTDDSFCTTLSEFATQTKASGPEKPFFAFVHQWIKKNYTPNASLKRAKTKSQVSQHKFLSFMDFSEEHTAQQMIYIDNKLFRGMKFSDFLHKNFERAPTSPGFTLMMQRFNTWGGWVASEIVSEKNLFRRAKIVSFFIKVAQVCLDMQAYNTAYGVIAGLGNSSVERLKQTWGLIDKDVLAKYNTLEEVFNMSKNYLNYRTILQSSVPPLVPFLGLYPKDLFAIEENLPTRTSQNLIAVTKLRKLHEIIRPLLDYQLGKNYAIKSDRVVHQFLKNLKVLDSEEIHKYSLACEARASANA